MDLLIQIAAACGPIMLAIMGVVVSLRPPHPMAHKFWAAAFIFVGFLGAAAIFFELRGSDQLQGLIWERVRQITSAPSQPGRHLLPDQKQRIRVGLALGPDESFGFQINSMPSCDECEQFAEEIRDFFNTIPGWQAGGGPLIFPQDRPRRNLLLVARDQDHLAIVDKIYNAFADGGVRLVRSNEELQPGTFVILVARPGS